MGDNMSAQLSKLHFKYAVRRSVLRALQHYGPMTIHILPAAACFRYDDVVEAVAYLRERGHVFVCGTDKSDERGRPMNVYGIAGLHKATAKTGDRVLALLREKGDSPCLGLSRELRITPKTCRYHLGRLLAARKVQVVGTIQRATGGTPAAIWSADV